MKETITTPSFLCITAPDAALTAYNMKQVKDIITTPLLSPYRGSEKTAEMVRVQVAERWGVAAGKKFNPQTDAMPFFSWHKYGYQVKKGEKALKSITFIETEDPETGEPKTIRKTVCLFYKEQVEPIVKKVV